MTNTSRDAQCQEWDSLIKECLERGLSAAKQTRGQGLQTRGQGLQTV